MADDRAVRLTARLERIRQEQMADANQQLLEMINALVAVIGDQNNAQANRNQLIQDAIDAIRANTAAGGDGVVAQAAHRHHLPYPLAQWLLIASLIFQPRKVPTSTRLEKHRCTITVRPSLTVPKRNCLIFSICPQEEQKQWDGMMRRKELRQ